MKMTFQGNASYISVMLALRFVHFLVIVFIWRKLPGRKNCGESQCLHTVYAIFCYKTCTGSMDHRYELLRPLDKMHDTIHNRLTWISTGCGMVTLLCTSFSTESWISCITFFSSVFPALCFGQWCSQEFCLRITGSACQCWSHSILVNAGYYQSFLWYCWR